MITEISVLLKCFYVVFAKQCSSLMCRTCEFNVCFCCTCRHVNVKTEYYGFVKLKRKVQWGIMIFYPLNWTLTHTNTECAEHDVVQSTKWIFSYQLQLVYLNDCSPQCQVHMLYVQFYIIAFCYLFICTKLNFPSGSSYKAVFVCR